jgi:hypothetical protein
VVFGKLQPSAGSGPDADVVYANVKVTSPDEVAIQLEAASRVVIRARSARETGLIRTDEDSTGKPRTAALPDNSSIATSRKVTCATQRDPRCPALCPARRRC